MYYEALKQFVLNANEPIIRQIKEMADEQTEQEKKWFTARQQVAKTSSKADLEAFDLKIYTDMVSHCAGYQKRLGALGVPLFKDKSDPRSQQKLLAVLGDLSRAK